MCVALSLPGCKYLNFIAPGSQVWCCFLLFLLFCQPTYFLLVEMLCGIRRNTWCTLVSCCAPPFITTLAVKKLFLSNSAGKVRRPFGLLVTYELLKLNAYLSYFDAAAALSVPILHWNEYTYIHINKHMPYRHPNWSKRFFKMWSGRKTTYTRIINIIKSTWRLHPLLYIL